jgi:hypothetical protein
VLVPRAIVGTKQACPRGVLDVACARCGNFSKIPTNLLADVYPKSSEGWNDTYLDVAPDERCSRHQAGTRRLYEDFLIARARAVQTTQASWVADEFEGDVRFEAVQKT